MWKRLKAYLERVESMLEDDDAATDWDAVLSEHLVQISFFQHERFIHLLVTLAFAFMELACALATALSQQLVLASLTLLLLIPLAPYVVHYYHLENGTQRLYEQYDRMMSKRK